MGTQQRLREIYDDFLDVCRIKKFTKTTMKFYQSKLGAFITWAEANGYEDLEQCSSRTVNKYLLQLEARKVSEVTIHGHCRVITTFFRFCKKEEYISTIPNVVKPRLAKRRPVVFTDEEIKCILDACTTLRDRAIVLWMLDTGCRCSEVVNVTYGDVNFEENSVFIRQAKGKKDRKVFFSDVTRRALRKYLRNKTLPAKSKLWVSENGGFLTESGLMQLFERLRNVTGIPHCKSHTCRKTMASRCLRNNMNLYHLAQILGHSSVEILKIYVSVLDDDLKDSHQKFGGLEIKGIE